MTNYKFMLKNILTCSRVTQINHYFIQKLYLGFNNTTKIYSVCKRNRNRGKIITKMGIIVESYSDVVKVNPRFYCLLKNPFIKSWNVISCRKFAKPPQTHAKVEGHYAGRDKEFRLHAFPQLRRLRGFQQCSEN